MQKERGDILASVIRSEKQDHRKKEERNVQTRIRECGTRAVIEKAAAGESRRISVTIFG